MITVAILVYRCLYYGPAIYGNHQMSIESYATGLYCGVLWCIVLYCIVLYCIVLYCIVFETGGAHAIPTACSDPLHPCWCLSAMAFLWVYSGVYRVPYVQFLPSLCECIFGAIWCPIWVTISQ